MDLHKNYRPNLEAHVQPFLDAVQKFYHELPQTLSLSFSGKRIPQGATTQQVDPQKASTLIRSTQSFKVLTECPLIVVLLFQLYPRYLQSSLQKFMPLIINALNLKYECPANADSIPGFKHIYTDFIATQVKTLSFLAYMLRGFAKHLLNYKDRLPAAVIDLLRRCPPSATAIRKELLIATRHILATDFRDAFIPHIEELTSENLLIGTGRTCYETLRPLAYSTLVDLVHHVREKLTMPQLANIVYLYSRNIHDPTLPLSIQTLSAKILRTLVESIVCRNTENVIQGRTLLICILDSFVNKFSSLKSYIPTLFDESSLHGSGTSSIPGGMVPTSSLPAAMAAPHASS